MHRLSEDALIENGVTMIIQGPKYSSPKIATLAWLDGLGISSHLPEPSSSQQQPLLEDMCSYCAGPKRLLVDQTSLMVYGGCMLHRTDVES